MFGNYSYALDTKLYFLKFIREECQVNLKVNMTEDQLQFLNRTPNCEVILQIKKLSGEMVPYIMNKKDTFSKLRQQIQNNEIAGKTYEKERELRQMKYTLMYNTVEVNYNQVIKNAGMENNTIIHLMIGKK